MCVSLHRTMRVVEIIGTEVRHDEHVPYKQL